MQYGNAEEHTIVLSAVGCLNRTMQYGNKYPNKIKKYEYHRLNRTMQYGNCSYISSLKILCGCLNRTMQYGNNDILDKYEKNEKFKSYYVVWKLFSMLFLFYFYYV